MLCLYFVYRKVLSVNIATPMFKEHNSLKVSPIIGSAIPSTSKFLGNIFSAVFSAQIYHIIEALSIAWATVQSSPSAKLPKNMAEDGS